MTAGKLLHTISTDKPVEFIAFNPCEFVVAISTDAGIHVHDLGTFECISERKGDCGFISFHPEGNELLGVRRDGLDVHHYLRLGTNNLKSDHVVGTY